MTVVMPETQTPVMEDLFPYEDSDDSNRRTHLVNPPDNPHISYGRPDMEGQEVVDTARALGLHVVALCRYTWIPRHNPDKFDVCEACMKIAGDIMRELGE